MHVRLSTLGSSVSLAGVRLGTVRSDIASRVAMGLAVLVAAVTFSVAHAGVARAQDAERTGSYVITAVGLGGAAWAGYLTGEAQRDATSDFGLWAKSGLWLGLVGSTAGLATGTYAWLQDLDVLDRCRSYQSGFCTQRKVASPLYHSSIIGLSAVGAAVTSALLFTPRRTTSNVHAAFTGRTVEVVWLW